MANTTDLQQETSPTTETTITYDGCSETVDCPRCGAAWEQEEVLREDRTVGPLGCCGWRGMWDYTTTYGHHPGDYPLRHTGPGVLLQGWPIGHEEQAIEARMSDKIAVSA